MPMTMGPIQHPQPPAWQGQKAETVRETDVDKRTMLIAVDLPAPLGPSNLKI
jgi:hypothetical protein